ncbi:MAG: hypothetical protein FK733_12565 [Asgard group archaeon]|nr:hypothetical protein [Asgard group archaeon]
MSRKTKYMTGLSIVMLVLFSGLAVPTIITAINIARNYSEYDQINIDYAPGEYYVSPIFVSESARINIDIRSDLANDTITDIPIIFSIMLEATFEEWVLLGEPEPTALNSTYFTESPYINIDNLNLNVNYGRTYYFIVYNNNSVDVLIDVYITLIPWSSIIGVSVTGFLFSLFFLIFLTKILSTAIINGVITIKGKKHSNSPSISRSTSNDESKKNDIKGQFCQSCGAPMTPKDGQYCPNCGASV